MNAYQLATRLSVPPNAITAIINGQRGVSGAMSKLLGHAFDVSEAFFANLQTRYELDRATMDAEAGGKAAERLRRADDLARELAAANH